MEREELVQAVEAMIFASGKAVTAKILAEILEVETDEVEAAATELRQRLVERNSGVQLIQVNGAYQLATLEKFYSYICKMLDNRPKPTLSQAALEVLSIVAYNQCTTRAEIEKIRGVSSDSALNKLLEYMEIRSMDDIYTYRLFGWIPFMWIRERHRVRSVYLFGCLIYRRRYFWGRDKK